MIEPNENRSFFARTGLGLVLALAYVTTIGLTWDGIGYAKDEGYYFSAAKSNFGWYTSLFENLFDGHPERSFTEKDIERHWKNNAEHPPLLKVLMGLSNHLTNRWIPLLNYGNSHRSYSLLFSFLLILFLYRFTAERWGPPVAVGAVALYSVMPHPFFHAHLNAFDTPAVALWLLGLLIFRRAMVSRRWAWGAGLYWGTAIASRNLMYFLPFLFLVLYMVSPYRRRFFTFFPAIPQLIQQTPKWKFALVAACFVLPFPLWAFGVEWLNLGIVVSLVVLCSWLSIALLRKNSTFPLHWATALSTLLFAPLLQVVYWPWIWFDTWSRLGVFFKRHLNPPAWETYYLGDMQYNPPPFPWHYPFVMSSYTIPVTILFLLVVGLAVLVWRMKKIAPKENETLQTAPKTETFSTTWESGHVLCTEDEEKTPVVTPRWDTLLVLLGAVTPLLIIANPKTPVYGGTKHFMAALPFLAIGGALVLKQTATILAGVLRSEKAVAPVFSVLLTIALVPGVLGIANAHPQCLSYYNELMGGTNAAEEVGMQRTFWAVSTRGVLDELNRIAPERAKVYYNNTPWDSLNAYRQDGLLRKDLRRTDKMDDADFFVLNNWRVHYDWIYEMRESLGTPYALYAVTVNGLPLCELYSNAKKHPDLTPMSATDKPVSEKSEKK